MFIASQNEHRNRPIRITFYLLWLIFSLTQAYFTNLAPDEAYYWRYSRDLAWGYFDHPPVVAAMIKCGYFFMKNELGVRLLFIAAMTATIYITERLTRPKDLTLFYMAVSSIAVLHIVGIMAVPDVPLLLFTASFFLLYERYSEKEQWYHIPLLSLNIALLLLSKYHGILLLFFTIVSNLRLLHRPSFWAIVSLSLALFIPHVLWQHTHNYPSISYHLFERNPLSYDISFTLNYLGAIPLIFAPLTGIVSLYFSLRNGLTTKTARAMRFTIWGTLVFFLLMSFRGRIEGNWVLFLCIPAICLGFGPLLKKVWAARFIRISFVATAVLVLAGRILLLDGGPWYIKTEFTGWKKWARQVHSEAGDEPVAFINSYQKAAEYEFYTGGKAFPLNNFMGRKDQYSIWNIENDLQGKAITVLSNYYIADTFRSLGTIRDTCQFIHIPNFRSSSNLRLTTDTKEVVTYAGDSLRISFSVTVAYGSRVDAEANPYYPMYISYHYLGVNGVQNTSTPFVLNNDLIRSGKRISLSIPAPGTTGDYLLGLSVSTGWMPPSINGGKIRVKVL